MKNRFIRWPWPTVLPFIREGTFPSLYWNKSIASEVKGVMLAGDIAAVSALCLGIMHLCDHLMAGDYASLKYHTSGMPPALIAQDFSFDGLTSHRKISPNDAKRYISEANSMQGPVENFIFKY